MRFTGPGTWYARYSMIDVDSGMVRARGVAKHWKLRKGPHFTEVVARHRIAQVDDLGRERNCVLVERNQRLVAKRGERVHVESECHGVPQVDVLRRCFFAGGAEPCTFSR